MEIFNWKKFIVNFSILVLFLCITSPLYSQMKGDTEQEDKANNQSDSLRVYPAKMSSKQTWEKIVDFPGDLLFLPIEIVFTGIEKTVEFIDERNIIPRTVNFFKYDLQPFELSPKYSSRYGLGIKVGYPNLFHEGSKSSLTVSRGLRGRQRFSMDFQQLKLFGNAFSTDITIQHRLLPDESFFGIGNDSQFSYESNFALRQSIVEASIDANLARQTKLNIRLGIDVNNVREGRNTLFPTTTDLETEESLPGLEKGTRIARVQFGITRNSVDKEKRPTAGGLLLVNGRVYKDIKKDKFSFWKFFTSYRHYIHLIYNRTIVLRVAGEITEPFFDNKIPFYYFGELGEEETIRGYTRGRFRDQDMLLGSIEYRYPLWRFTDAGFFIDAGQVSQNIFKKFSRYDFHTGYGGYLSFWGTDRLIGQFTIGKSKDMVRYYFSLNKVF